MSLCLLFLFEDLETLEGAFEKKKKKISTLPGIPWWLRR